MHVTKAVHSILAKHLPLLTTSHFFASKTRFFHSLCTRKEKNKHDTLKGPIKKRQMLKYFWNGNKYSALE